jgi:hypothetical protein
MAKAKTITKEATVDVKLDKDHEHDRVQYKAGDTIKDVPKSTADYMEQRAIGKPVAA